MLILSFLVQHQGKQKQNLQFTFSSTYSNAYIKTAMTYILNTILFFIVTCLNSHSFDSSMIYWCIIVIIYSCEYARAGKL